MSNVTIPAVPLSTSKVNGSEATETPREMSKSAVNGVVSTETPMLPGESVVNGTHYIVGNR
jgi:hypothetical protein